MPDTGAPWNIPYVAGTDLVADWPTDSQTLAEAIADGLDAAGGVVQVVQTVKSDYFSASVAAGGTTALTGLSVSITPTDATHKVLLLCQLSGIHDFTSGGRSLGFILKRGATAVGVGDADSTSIRVNTAVGYRDGAYDFQSGSITYLDSPATTSATTYSVDVANLGGATNTLYVNRGQTTGGSPAGAASSTITAIEVKV